MTYNQEIWLQDLETKDIATGPRIRRYGYRIKKQKIYIYFNNIIITKPHEAKKMIFFNFFLYLTLSP